MSIDKFKPRNDMASFLRIPVPCFMLPLYKERKVNIAFVPFNSEWKKNCFYQKSLQVMEAWNIFLSNMISCRYTMKIIHPCR